MDTQKEMQDLRAEIDTLKRAVDYLLRDRYFRLKERGAEWDALNEVQNWRDALKDGR